MSAKNSDLKRVRELLGVIRETQDRVAYSGLSREAFLSSASLESRILADSLLMCVFRATEEASSMSEETRSAHPEIAWRGIKSMRNILANDYGQVDREMVWDSIEHDFPVLERFCRDYLEENGVPPDDEG